MHDSRGRTSAVHPRRRDGCGRRTLRRSPTHDAQIGKVVGALESAGFAEDTVVALWGDHGFQLGDNDQWAKQTNFGHATRIPLIVHVPGQLGGGRSDALVEAVDIMPFLVEASSGVVVPHCPPTQAESRTTALCTEGFSLLPLIPMREPASPLSPPPSPARQKWQRVAAHSQFRRGCEPKIGAPCDTAGGTVAVMGYTQRMDQLRYTAWVRFNYSTASPDWSTEYGRELYDHRANPVPKDWAMEHVNVVALPEHADLVEELHSRLVRCGARPDLC